MAIASTTIPVAPKIVTDSSYQWTVDPQITMTISTSGNVKASGPVVIDLQPQQAPITVANMLTYVNSGFYTDAIFHRVIYNFMIQAGLAGTSGDTTDPYYGFIRNPIYSPIILESNNGLSNLRGTIAMARTPDPNSASAQFFINTVDNPFLNYTDATNPGYAVFGKVLSGMTVIDSISKLQTGYVPNTDYKDIPLPLSSVVISSIQQTKMGSAITTSTTIDISDIASDASWSYSLDSGKNWLVGHGTSIILPTGKYSVNQIEVKQTTAGVDSHISNFTSALEVDAVNLTSLDFSTVLTTVAVSDTSVTIAKNLDVLQDVLPKITAITQTDSSLLDLKVNATQVRRDASVLTKIGNYHLAVNDTGNKVYSNIADLHSQLVTGHLSSIKLSAAPTKKITSSQYIAYDDVLKKVVGKLNINIDASSVKPEKLDFSANVHGAPSAKHFDSITGWNTGDSISYSAAAGHNLLLKTFVHKGVTPGTAAINAKGVATFDPKDNTLALKIAAVEKALGLAPTHKAGQFSMWTEGENTKVLIRDGSHSASEKILSISAGDELIQLVGINPSHVHFDSALGVLSYL